MQSLTESSLSKEEVLNVSKSLLQLEQEKGMRTDILACIPPCLFPKELINHQMASHGCSAGRDTAVISPQGFVRRCAALSEIYGNLLEEDLTTIWKRINNVKKVVNSTCADCMPGEYCYGGCEARVLAEGKERYVCGLDECKKTGFIENLIKKELIYSQQ